MNEKLCIEEVTQTLHEITPHSVLLTKCEIDKKYVYLQKHSGYSMSEDVKIPGFENFLLNAQEIKSSADDLIESGIVYNVQCNIARCLLSINENKANGQAVVTIGLDRFIPQNWGNDFLDDVKKKIFGEDWEMKEPKMFVGAQSRPEVFLLVLARTISDLGQRGFVSVISNEFGLQAGFVASQMEQRGGNVGVTAPYFLDEGEIDSIYTQVEKIFLMYRDYTLNLDEKDLAWLFEETSRKSGFEMTENWPYPFSPNLDLLISW